MSRSDPTAPGADPQKLTAEECQELAQQVADELLQPSAAPFREGFLAARRNPSLLKGAAEPLGFLQSAQDTAWLVRFGNALARKDRRKLVSLIGEAFRQNPPTFEQAQRLRRFDLRAVFRKGLVEVAEQFKGERGISAKIEPDEYPKIAALGDQLTPACEKILAALAATPEVCLREIVKDCCKDDLDAYSFLLRHLERLKSALEDRALLNRARKLDTRARLLADAMAGAEHDLTLRTSLERARSGRRSLGRMIF